MKFFCLKLKGFTQKSPIPYQLSNQLVDLLAGNIANNQLIETELKVDEETESKI